MVPSNWVSGTVPVMECVRGGLTGTSEPKWQSNASFLDGAARWKIVGVATIYEILSINENETNRVETIIKVREIN